MMRNCFLVCVSGLITVSIICCLVSVTLDTILGIEDILISWFLIILVLLDVTLLLVCCLICCKHLRLSDVNKHTYLISYFFTRSDSVAFEVGTRDIWWALLQISCSVRKCRNFENRPTVGEIMTNTVLMACFFDSRCTFGHISVQLISITGRRLNNAYAAYVRRRRLIGFRYLQERNVGLITRDYEAIDNALNYRPQLIGSICGDVRS